MTRTAKGALYSTESRLYHKVVAPLVGLLPAPIAYGTAILRGDLIFRFSSSRKDVLNCLRLLFGDRFNEKESRRIARDHFRIRSCEPIDAIRLLGSGSSLTKLVEIRGLNYLQQASSRGRGAVLCSAHFGSLRVIFSLVGALGFPVTVVARWSQGNGPEGERGKQSWGWPYTSAFHLQSSNILQGPGAFDAASKGMNVVRNNGFLGIMIDSQAEPGDLSKPSTFEFLGQRVELVPGASAIALAAGAPLIVVLLRRSADWRHQVLEIAPPMYVEGDPAAAYAKCLALVESAVRTSPAHWNKLNPTDLVQMRLVRREDVSPRVSKLMAP